MYVVVSFWKRNRRRPTTELDVVTNWRRLQVWRYATTTWFAPERTWSRLWRQCLCSSCSAGRGTRRTIWCTTSATSTSTSRAHSTTLLSSWSSSTVVWTPSSTQSDTNRWLRWSVTHRQTRFWQNQRHLYHQNAASRNFVKYDSNTLAYCLLKRRFRQTWLGTYPLTGLLNL